VSEYLRGAARDPQSQPQPQSLPLRIELMQLAENSADAINRDADPGIVDLDPQLVAAAAGSVE